MPIRGVEILHIWNLRMLMRKIVIYLVSRKFYLQGLFAVKVNGSDVTQESVQGFSYRHIPGSTSYPSTLTAIKYMKMNFSAEFFPWVSEDFKYVKSPNPGTPQTHFCLTCKFSLSFYIFLHFRKKIKRY